MSLTAILPARRRRSGAQRPSRTAGTLLPASDRAGGSLACARGVELDGQWGQVFGPLDLDLDRDGLTVLAAPAGAARTALMMALCGRMKIDRGGLRVLGHANDPRAVFAESAIACFDELDGIQPSVTVQDLITEQIRWESSWYRWVPRATTKELEEKCGYLFEGLPLPPIDAFIADLPEAAQALLRIGVANTRRPPLLVVGRLDRIADEEQRTVVARRLALLGEEQSVIAADVNGDDYGGLATEVVPVPDLLEFQQRSEIAREIAREIEDRRRSHGAEEDRQDEDEDEDDAAEEEGERR